MKKKINTYLMLTVLLTLLSALLMAVAVFHHFYREQVMEDMKLYTGLLGGLILSGSDEKEQLLAKTLEAAGVTGSEEQLRVTEVNQDGTVLFDSETGAEKLGNHAARPEIQEAVEEGEGCAIRHSDTLDRDMYYYAKVLGNGRILRVSKEAASIWKVFGNTIAGLAGIALLMFAVCLFLAHSITGTIVRPIEQLAGNLEQTGGADTYEELVPILTTIQEQHKDIIRGAKMRQEFTASVSHELKTPLTSISGYAELIEAGFAGENEVRRFAREIHRGADRLLTLINDIIRLSELDSDLAEFSCVEVDLYEVAANCVEMLQIHAANHEVAMEVHGSCCLIQADRGMVEELVYNLCDNAIRYNNRGGRVDVTVAMRRGCAVLSVKDTGIGIGEKDQERVFERFYRVDKSRSKRTGGTGLGLAIVKHIVARHHAQLELASEVGRGTEITVTFPPKEG